MLGSITPLGERSRGRVWGRTVAALIVGGALGGAAVGGLAGLGGLLVFATIDVDGSVRLGLLAAVLATASLLDIVGTTPGPHRQVNEDWLTIYRGWVYGLGFGFQLGSGVLTIVVSSSVLAVLAAAALTGSVVGGLAIGATFGLLRTSTVLFGARATTWPRAAAVHDAVERLEKPFTVATPAALGVLSVFALGLAL
jgi:hypothetical protein